LDLALKKFGMNQSLVDPCVYFKVYGIKRTYLAVYIDDFMIFSNDLDTKSFLKSELKNRFQMTDLGEAKFCVGIRITRDREHGVIYLDQDRHILDLLAKFSMADCKPVMTPCDINKKLTFEMCPTTLSEKQDMANVPYQEAIGGLLYLSQGTRPDISYTVNMLSKFNKNPGRQHWEAVKRVMRYLKGTLHAKLKFSKDGNPSIFSYTDSDWASDEDDRRSCTGHVFIKQGGAISWNSKRQPTIALSSTEAEYMALSSCAQEALFYRQLETDLGSSISDIGTKVYCDNKGAIDLSKSSGFNARTKHMAYN
jgi:Reverse transcriptase (RNA-dependent DNA polymerase)